MMREQVHLGSKKESNLMVVVIWDRKTGREKEGELRGKNPRREAGGASQDIFVEKG